MKATRKVGIWLDHTTARVIEYNIEELKATTIKSDLQGLDNQDGLQHSENLLHNKENQKLKTQSLQLTIYSPNNSKIICKSFSLSKT